MPQSMCDRPVSYVSLSWRRLNSLGIKGFWWSFSLIFLVIEEREERGPMKLGGPVAGLQVLISPLFPMTERYPSEFSQGCKYPGALSFFRGPADQSLDFQITTCPPRARKMVLMTDVERRQLEGQYSSIHNAYRPSCS